MTLKKQLVNIKIKRIIFPGVNLKILKPVSGSLVPLDLFVSGFGLLVIAQLVYYLKGLLSLTEVNKLPSLQFYSKFFSSNFHVNRLVVIYAISQTIGFDLEILITLNVSERLSFISELQKRILVYSGTVKLFSNWNFLLDPLSLLKHRKALSLKLRSFMLLSCFFSPSSLVVNTLLSDVNLSFLLESCKMVWLHIGLDLEDFNFVLLKSFFLVSDFNHFEISFNNNLVLAKIIKFQFEKFSSFDSYLVFSDDFIVLKSENNLTALETELSFIFRPFPFLLGEESFIPILVSKDFILESAYEQRIKQRKKILSVFNRVGKYHKKNIIFPSDKILSFEKGAMY